MLLLQQECKCDEIIRRQLLRSLRENGFVETIETGRQDTAKRVPKRFPTLSESCFHHCFQGFLATWKFLAVIACQTYYTALHFGRGVENGSVYGEEVFDIVPKLQ